MFVCREERAIKMLKIWRGRVIDAISEKRQGRMESEYRKLSFGKEGTLFEI